MKWLIILAIIIFYLWLANFISYHIIKKRILKSQKWDLNICCGKTDGGGINADIIKHKELANFVLIKDIYNLPFKNKQFNTVLCSHTLEHVDYPEKFFKELKRVGRKVTIVVPQLYDISATFDIFEHKWIFLSFKKKHDKLPKYVKFPLANFIHKHFGQIIHA